LLLWWFCILFICNILFFFIFCVRGGGGGGGANSGRQFSRATNYDPGFLRELVGNCSFVGYYTACSCDFLPTFRGNLSVQYSGVRNLDS